MVLKATFLGLSTRVTYSKGDRSSLKRKCLCFLKFVHRKRSIWAQTTEREMVFVEGSTAVQKQKETKTIARKVANAFWRERSAKHGSILLRNNKLTPVSIGGSASLSNRTRRAEFILKETVVVVYVSADDILLVSCVIFPCMFVSEQCDWVYFPTTEVNIDSNHVLPYGRPPGKATNFVLIGSPFQSASANSIVHRCLVRR